nr:hypothetical protein [Prevotella sp. UBA5379]
MNKNKKEEFIKKKFGKKQPFRVPDGYFDDFSGRLMARLAAQNKPVPMVCSLSSRRRAARKHFIWRASLIAASILAAVFSLNLIFSRKDARPVQTAQKPAQSITVDQAADYAMMDNEDIYTDLVEGNNH